MQLQEAESGGTDTMSLHTPVDVTSSLEIYSQTAGSSNLFYPLGWWVLD